MKLLINGREVRLPFEVERLDLVGSITPRVIQNDRRLELEFTGGSGGLSDGDYGDVTVSGGGTAIAIDSDAVTYAKIQNVSASRLLGRYTASSGDIEEMDVTPPLTIDPGGKLLCSAPTVTVNGASTGTAIDLDDATPAVTAGSQNVTWSKDASAPMNISGKVIQGPTLFKVLDAGAAGTTGSTAAQPWFPTAGAVTVTANRAYRFCGLIAVTRDNTGALSIGFGGTATVSSILAYSIGQSAAANTNGTAQTSSWRNSTALVVAAPSANVSWAWIEGVMRIGTGGTIIPQFSTSISAITTITVERNTFFEMTEIGSDTVTTRGTWS